jgi:dUTP pyrophosphatase|tara:strand:- start:4244 stop:4684 length:441 start_codon:yes stop_codon:yes gene_type:complete
MKITKIKDVKTPTRANTTDAGVDFFIPNDYTGKTDLSPGESCFIPSGIKVNVPEGYALIAFNKSGVATKKGLHVGACVVDCGYQGELHINLTNVSAEDQTIAAGDKIVQFVLLPLGDPAIELVEENNLYESVSTRGEGGFGSSGTK